MSRHSDKQIEELIALIRDNHQDRAVVSAKNINVLVMGVIAAVAALVWTTVIQTPENFGLLQQQTAEIRTTVMEMRSALTDLTEKLEGNQRQTAEQQARIAGLQAQVARNSESIQRLEERVNNGRN